MQVDEERRRLEATLAEYQHMSESIDATAKARHDLRNQLSVISALASNGDWQEADRQLDDFCTTYRIY